MPRKYKRPSEFGPNELPAAKREAKKYLRDRASERKAQRELDDFVAEVGMRASGAPAPRPKGRYLENILGKRKSKQK